MNANTNAAASPVHVFVGQGRKVHRAYLAHNGQASTVCGAERRGLGVTYTRKTDAAISCQACSPAQAEEPAEVQVPASESHAFSAKGSAKASACVHCGRTWAAAAHRAHRAAA